METKQSITSLTEDLVNPLGLEQIFCGRNSELAVLQQELLGPTPKTVCITGVGGIGKTTLASMFAEQNREAFPAGVWFVSANQVEPVDETVGRDVQENTSPCLIVIDYLDVRPQERITLELAAMRHRYPSARVLAISRQTISSSSVDLQLAIGGLSQEEFRTLIEKRLAYSPQPEFADDLYGALKGHPLAAALVTSLLRSGEINPRKLLQRLNSFTWPGIFDTRGKKIPEGAPALEKIQADVVGVSEDFLRKLNENPRLLYDLSYRGFEELVAELLSRLDYEVVLTPASKDGGKDIYAAKKDHLGTFLYVVECKKYAPDRPVGVGLIRQLNGVVQAEQATAGILATTSFFTRGANEFQKTVASQISLKDYLGIQEWLSAALKK